MSCFIFEKKLHANYHFHGTRNHLPILTQLEHLIYNILFSRQTSQNPRSDASQVSLKTSPDDFAIRD